MSEERTHLIGAAAGTKDQRIADQVEEQRLLTTIQLIEAPGGGWQDSTIYTPGATPAKQVSTGPSQ